MGRSGQEGKSNGNDANSLAREAILSSAIDGQSTIGSVSEDTSILRRAAGCPSRWAWVRGQVSTKRLSRSVPTIVGLCFVAVRWGAWAQRHKRCQKAASS